MTWPGGPILLTAPSLASPVPDHAAPDRTDFSGDSATITTGPQAAAWLDAARTTASTTDFVVLLAVWSLFLARHTGRRDLTTGTLVSGRDHPDTATLIGFFVNTLALRIRVDPDVTFPVHLAAVRQAVLDAFARQEIPFEHVVRAVAPHRTAARNPLFTTSYGHETTAVATRTLPGGLTLTPRPAGGTGGSHFDLSLDTARTPGGIALNLAYSTDLYDHATITGYLDSLAGLLATLATHPHAPVGQLLEPAPPERELLASWNDAAAAPSSAVPLHDLIAAQAAAAPEVIAVQAQDLCLTYGELDAAATTVALRLRRAGVREGDIVGVHLRPGAVAIAAILAAWKTGAAFLPLDPDLPQARITAMIDDARPALLVTDAPTPRPELDFVLAGLPGPDEIRNAVGELPVAGPGHLAYLMYTSGSTGQPKGVMIHHGGVSNHAVAQVLARTSPPGRTGRKRVAAGTSAFIADFFISQLATLAGGHTLVVLDRDQRQDPRYLVALAGDPARAITALDCTTSQLQLHVESGLLDAPCPPQVISLGGEACPPDLWTTLRSYPALTAFNAYGPAETSVDATIVDVAEGLVPLIGRAYGNAVIRILDDRQRPVPPGTTGELCIAGPGVGYGYLNRPAQTAAVFIPDPWGPPGTRLYRSGDLARFTRDGLLEFLGRTDLQIKILGQRVEPEEIEAVLRDHPEITAAAVTHHGSPRGIQLTAHLIAAEGTSPDPGAIRTWLAQRLPAAVVPASLRLTTSFPFTAGGKLDRKTLTAQAAELDLSRVPEAPPSTSSEHQIAAIWSSLLGYDPGSLGVHDDFFALGGHSLLAARLALRLSAELGTDLPLHQVFAHPTIAGQAAWISEHAGTPAAAPIPRLAREPGAAVPASFAQERLWFLWQLAPGSSTYHVPWAYETTGLDVERLAAAVDAMIERHEVFRTTLHDFDGQIVQRIGLPWKCGLTPVPASTVLASPDEAAAAAQTSASELFNLSQGPLLRVQAWATGPDTHLLLFTAHHVVIDEWSLEIFERELWALYAGAGLADLSIQAAPAIRYADYASWHRDLIAARTGADLAWWASTLDGAEPVSPVPDHAVPDRTDFSGSNAVVTAGPAALAWLDAARITAAATDFVVLLALYSIFLARHAGRRDLTIGTHVSGRDHPDTAAMIGFFVNTVALRIRVDTALAFPGHVAYIRQVVLDAFAHQEIPFEHVVRAVAPHRAAASNPLFTTSYAHEPATSLTGRALPGGLTLTPRPAGGDGSHFDLTLNTARTPGGLVLGLQYSTALYDQATITGYLDALTGLLATLTADPGTPVRQLLEPTPRETARLISWNDAGAAPTSAVPLQDLIAAQAAATPDATAIEAADTCLTYRELDTAAGGLALRLRRAGVRDGDIIGVHLRPGATAITAILAAWKAGAAFLPLDPDLPSARITAMIDDARPALLVTYAPSPRPAWTTSLDGRHGQEDDDRDTEGGLPAVGPDHLAYLMYTSGSTGQPKAVMIHHGGVSNHAVAQVLPRTGPGPMRIAAGTSAFISDFFIGQLATLAGGHTLVVLTRDQRQDPRYLAGLAADPARAVTALDCTTSQLQLLVEAGLLDAPCPPQVTSFGGEACPPDLWTALRSYPALTALNAYGPAETSVDATISDVAEGLVPLIGRAYGNAVIRILDDRQRPVPPAPPASCASPAQVSATAT